MSSKGSSPHFDIVCPVRSAGKMLLIYQNLSKQTNKQKLSNRLRNHSVVKDSSNSYIFLQYQYITYIILIQLVVPLNFQIFLCIHLLSPSPHLPYNDPQKYERNSSADSQLYGGSRLALTEKVHSRSCQQHKQRQHSNSKQPCDNPNGAAQLPGRAKAVFWKFGQIHDRFRKFRQKM